MKRFLITASAAALIAIPAWALVGQDHRGMHGPQTRAEAEAKVKERFAEIDTNKDGVITHEEADAFKTARREKMRDKMFAMMDTDKNGQISRAEFDAHHRDGAADHGMRDGKDDGDHDQMGEGGMDHGRMGHGMGRGHMMMHGDLFAKADANGDGKVTLSEATSKALEMFDRVDANKDGTVTPEERRAAWKNWMEQRRDKTS